MSKEQLNKLKETLTDFGYEDTIVFENYDYASAFIGVTNAGVAVYDFDDMVQCLVEEEVMDEIEEIEWIEYNTEGAYFGPGTPIIAHRLEV